MGNHPTIGVEGPTSHTDPSSRNHEVTSNYAIKSQGQQLVGRHLGESMKHRAEIAGHVLCVHCSIVPRMSAHDAAGGDLAPKAEARKRHARGQFVTRYLPPILPQDLSAQSFLSVLRLLPSLGSWTHSCPAPKTPREIQESPRLRKNWTGAFLNGGIKSKAILRARLSIPCVHRTRQRVG